MKTNGLIYTRKINIYYLERAKFECLHEAWIIGRIVSKVRQLLKRHVFNGILNTTFSQYLE